MFRNARFYRIKTEWPKTEDELSEQLGTAKFRPCGPLTELSSGWEAPAKEVPDLLCRRISGADLLSLRSQTKVLPAAAINEALEERLVEWEQKMQEKPGARQKRKLKAEVKEELLPKALPKSERLRGMYLHASGILVIDSTSENKAERFIDRLRQAFGSADVVPLTYKQPVADWLNSLFLGGDSEGFRLGRECRMQEPTMGGAVVNWKDIDLDDKSVRQHVNDGMKIERMAVSYDDVVTCVIDQNGIVSKLKFVGSEGSSADTEDSDPLARQDAEFVLLSGTLSNMLDALKKQLGGIS